MLEGQYARLEQLAHLPAQKHLYQISIHAHGILPPIGRLALSVAPYRKKRDFFYVNDNKHFYCHPKTYTYNLLNRIKHHKHYWHFAG